MSESTDELIENERSRGIGNAGGSTRPVGGRGATSRRLTAAMPRPARMAAPQPKRPQPRSRGRSRAESGFPAR